MTEKRKERSRKLAGQWGNYKQDIERRLKTCHSFNIFKSYSRSYSTVSDSFITTTCVFRILYFSIVRMRKSCSTDSPWEITSFLSLFQKTMKTLTINSSTTVKFSTSRRWRRKSMTQRVPWKSKSGKIWNLQLLCQSWSWLMRTRVMKQAKRRRYSLQRKISKTIHQTSSTLLRDTKQPLTSP